MSIRQERSRVYFNMTQLLLGKPVVDRLRGEIKARAAEYRDSGIEPRLVIIRVGQKPEDVAYEERVLKNCFSCGIIAEVKECPENTKTEDLISILGKCGSDPEVHGILIFRPLPPEIDQDAVSHAVAAKKDSDCMNPENLEKLFFGDTKGVLPCTPEAVRELLLYYIGDLSGKNIVIVNRSLVLGKPLAMLLIQENATVTICHSKTKELKEITKRADIVVTGVGRAGYFGKEYFGPHSIVVDVGINEKNGGGICGDVDMSAVEDYVAGITPVPGGIGSITSLLLLVNVLAGAGK
jgi:methylenetetrahydrofolate dehydrogenase (NADP+) / methenyltetrahydrofolate cyclohydrolase